MIVSANLTHSLPQSEEYSLLPVSPYNKHYVHVHLYTLSCGNVTAMLLKKEERFLLLVVFVRCSKSVCIVMMIMYLLSL